MAGASARCGAEDAGIATLEVDSGRSCSRRRTSSPAIFEVQGDRFRSYSMFQNLNSAKAYSKSFLKMVSNTVRVLWLLRESVLTSVQRPANPAVCIPSPSRFNSDTMYRARPQFFTQTCSDGFYLFLGKIKEV
jgi:hypothetical protein